MKKTLVALAALAATSAFAQSNVTISGSLDFGVVNNQKSVTSTSDAAPAETTVKASQTSQLNSWTTNQLSFQGTEDMGGGTKASFVINTGLAYATSTLASRDAYVALENANTGKVQLGRFVPAAALGFHGYSGAASTATGSVYGLTSAGSAAGSSTQVTRFGGTAVMAAGDFERNDNQVQYASPVMNGFSLTANYGKNSSDSDAAAKAGVAKTIQSGLGLNYAQGPLKVGFGTQTRKVGTEVAAQVNNGAGVLGSAAVVEANKEGKMNWLGASYDMGVATAFGTRVTRKDTTTDAAGAETTNMDASLTSYGVRVPMGQYTFSASTYTGKDKRGVAATDDVKLSGRQLSVQYAMSKRTSIYALSGINKIARDAGGLGTSAALKQSTTMVGLLHTF